MKSVNCIACNSIENKTIWKQKPYAAVKCKNCGMICQNPQPNDTLSLYNQEYFSENYIAHIQKRSVYLENKWEKIKKLLPKRGKLLDVGCGIGLFMMIANKNGWSSTGIETSQFAADYGKKTFNLKIHASFENLEKETFDLITMWDSIAHIKNPETYIESIYNLLNPGGLLIIKTPNWSKWSFIFSNIVGNFTKKTPFFLHIPHQLYFFNLKTIRIFLERKKFKNIRISYVNEADIGKTIYSSNFFKNEIASYIAYIILKLNRSQSIVTMAEKEKQQNHQYKTSKNSN